MKNTKSIIDYRVNIRKTATNSVKYEVYPVVNGALKNVGILRGAFVGDIPEMTSDNQWFTKADFPKFLSEHINFM